MLIQSSRLLGLMLLGAVVYALSLVASPVSYAQSQFAGVYTGTFSGPADNGVFAFIVRTNNTAAGIAFDSVDELAFVNKNVTINPNGTFFVSNIDGQGTTASGTLTPSGVTGTFVDSRGFVGTISGTKEPATGWARTIGGFYSDDFSWSVQINGIPSGTVSGTWSLILAADGTWVEVVRSTLSVQFGGQTIVEPFHAGGLAHSASLTQLCQSASAGGFSITCSFNPSTFTFSGTVFASDSGITISGPYALQRIEPLPDLPPIASDDEYSVLVNRSTTFDASEGVLANDSDPEGDALTATLATGPAQGIVNLNADGSFTYTPNPGVTGSDSFTYRAFARSLPSNLATVTIDVNPIALPFLTILLDD